MQGRENCGHSCDMIEKLQGCIQKGGQHPVGGSLRNLRGLKRGLTRKGGFDLSVALH
jgi:hypothetical protein